MRQCRAFDPPPGVCDGTERYLAIDHILRRFQGWGFADVIPEMAVAKLCDPIPRNHEGTADPDDRTGASALDLLQSHGAAGHGRALGAVPMLDVGFAITRLDHHASCIVQKAAVGATGLRLEVDLTLPLEAAVAMMDECSGKTLLFGERQNLRER